MSVRIVIRSALVVGTVILALNQVASSLWDVPMATFTRDFQVTAGCRGTPLRSAS